MPVLGFLINIESLIGLVPRLLRTSAFLLTYRLSQDHLELFFSAVRRAGQYTYYAHLCDRVFRLLGL